MIVGCSGSGSQGRNGYKVECNLVYEDKSTIYALFVEAAPVEIL